ncbi:MYO9B [Branchiostoma lanceolatum]|uniref:MYO9B protein n=1 Tax=Branchiostoma lanceolatum TaxID=7740 RepID=A0A8K0EKN9_BRALA|nr:MYO9B [Branchiostoma lanceolatum]
MAATDSEAPMANQEAVAEDLHPLQIHPGPLVPEEPFIVLQVAKETTATDVICQLVAQYNLAGGAENYEIAEVCYTGGQNCKERLLQRDECPAQVQLIWPRKMPTTSNKDAAIYKFCLRETLHAFYSRWSVCSSTDSMNALMAEYFRPPSDKDYPDLCRLPDLNEHTLLDNLQVRFNQGKIYTYVGSILIAINPFKFFPIYNPKYVNMYQNHRLGELEPHIFAIADASYHTMLENRENQCIVISGESGSGKTESTNFLLHHLTALSYKGHASGIEQTILGAGPVLEAFGNAKTAHNDNSSRFGKFIQLNYKENGTVHGATVEKYLLEKSRIVSQASNERNYHVFYYLLAGANQALKDSLILHKPEEFFYLNQSNYEMSEGEDRVFEFNRLRQSMEMVGFYSGTQRRIFAVLSAVLHLGNIVFNRIFRDGEDAVQVKNPEELRIVSKLLKVKEETLLEALTSRTTIARRERIIISHRQAEAVATRDALAKSLYSGLFDWIVLQLNHALLHKEAKGHHQGNWIGVLDIFGFEDFGQQNSFEQFCINFANEHLQYYFNQHVFKLEQEEYQKEGIQWKNIDFIDNTGCLSLVAKRPTGLLHLLDEESRLPNATSETLLTKFHQQHEDNGYYERPQVNEPSFVIVHYAGKVKYQIQDFREKNIDLMRSDIVSVLKNSHMAFVREIISTDPVAVFRWAILRAFFRSVSAFRDAGKRWKTNQGKPRPAPRVRPSPRLRSTSSLSEVSEDEEVPTSPLSPAVPEDAFHSPTNKTLTPRSSPYSTPEPGSRHGSAGHPSRRESGSLFEQEGLLYSTTDPNIAKVLRRAANILMKNKSFRHGRPHKCLRDLRSVKTIVRREGKPSSTLRKAPATVSAQFSVSLSKLMETLNQAKPFFVRCIKSNSDKAPCKFDSQLVLRQLRYTGMLETVRIRQSGYSVRLTFQEFAHQFALLLKRGSDSSKEDIAAFLHSMELDDRHYQMGESKVFLRESERLKLQESLHEEVLRRIRVIQVWMRGMLQRKMYLRMKESVIKIQRNIRACLALRRLLAQQQEKRAAISIQSQWRGHRARRKCGEMQRERRAQEQALREMEEAKRRAQEAMEEEKARQKAEVEAAEIQTPPHINGSISPQLQDASPVAPESEDPEVKAEEDKPLQNDVKDVAKQFEERISPAEEPPMMNRSIRKSASLPATTVLAVQTAKEPEASRLLGSPSSSTPRLTSPTQTKAALKLHLSEDNITNLERVLSEKKAKIDSGQTPLLETPTSSPSTISSEIQTITKKLRKKFLAPRRRKPSNLTSDEEEGLKTPESIGVAVLPPFCATADDNVPPPHHDLKTTSLSKAVECGACGKNVVKEGSKCNVCNQVFHDRCCMKALTCYPSGSSKQKKRSKAVAETERVPTPPTGMNLKGASLENVPTNVVISNAYDLRQIDAFLLKKISDMNQDDGRRDTIVDVVFKKAMREYHSDLITTYSAAITTNEEVTLRYKDLISKFEKVLENVVSKEKTSAKFPVTLGINAFRGFLDEFVRNYNPGEKQVNKTSPVRYKRRKKDDSFSFNGHRYETVQFNIATFCEQCSNLIKSGSKGMLCQLCKFACHKKCYQKSGHFCKGFLYRKNRNSGSYEDQYFGADISTLLPEGRKVPVLVEKCISFVEKEGLYTVGIYRKSGAAAKIKQLRDACNADVEAVDMEAYPIHVVCNVLKLFFREMAEPLLTYALYDDFLRCTGKSFQTEVVVYLIH